MGFGFAQIFNIFSNIGIGAGNFLCEVNNVFNASEATGVVWETILEWFLTVVGNVLYTIGQFALSIIDIMQLVIYKFLGITTDVKDYKVYDANNPLIKFLTNSHIIDILKSAMIVAIVLVIVFSIFSIIKGEWDRASKDQEFNVKRVWGRAFKSVFGMIIFPATFMAVIILVNALLAAFSAALSNNSNITLGGQVFALSAYDANVYRNYANNNKRIPIYINFQDPYNDGTYTRYTTEELVTVYDAFASDGKELYNKFATSDFAGFSDTLTYNSANGSLTNNKSYSGYEKFICTAEQYQVMADFIDYAVTHNIEFYYKPVSDGDIEWKYVQDSVFNEDNHTLSITYADASNITTGSKSYTVTYQPADYDLGSPIQNALGTLSTLLSLDGNYYPTLEKLDGTINRVAWVTDKVHIKLSEQYSSVTGGVPDWTLMDQVILYEYYRYEYNNTFEGYTLQDLQNGIYLDAYKIECQYFRSYTDSYETLKTYDVAIINGTYYLIEQEVINKVKQYDAYGDPIYTLKNGDKKGTFLNNFSIYNSGLNKSNTSGEEDATAQPVADTDQTQASGETSETTTSTGTPFGVHIKILDETDHAKISTNTKTADGKCGCNSEEYSCKSENGCGCDKCICKSEENSVGACGCVAVADSSTATEVWYSAVYNMQSEPTKCGNVLTNICVADIEGRYAEDGVEIIEHEKYGFLNANGFAHEVDRVKATKQVKQVDWAHKLMGDIQNIYRDLNLQQLILTGEWLEVFNSKIEQIGGEYVASFDTSLISPQGLIFSEIFLGILQESDGSTLSEYMFASKYSAQDKKELVLALCGAENYETISITIDYFVEMFNQLFTPLLEKIMANEGQPFKDGEVTNVQLYTYKAYLCSLMLSSDSAGFFTEIANRLSIMYEFPYDIKVSLPGDYTYAVYIIQEYVFSTLVSVEDGITVSNENGTTTTYTKDANIYGDGEGLIPFSYDMSLFKDDIVKYLGDENGNVTLASLSEHYVFGSDNKLSKDDIDQAHTPRKLLDALNDKLSETYMSFADLVITENLNKGVYYGYTFGEDLGAWTNFRDTYYDLDTKSGQYQLKQEYKKYHNINQLDGYKKLCDWVYDKAASELEASSSESALMQIYQDIRGTLESQGIHIQGINWPTYLTVFKQFLSGKAMVGDLEYWQLFTDSTLLESIKNDKEIIYSSLIDKTNVDGKIGDYSAYLNNFKSAYSTLNSSSLLGTFVGAFNASNVITALLKKYAENNKILKLLGGETLITPDLINSILKFTAIDEIYDAIIDVLGTLVSNADDRINVISGFDEYLYEKSGLQALIEKYYGDPNTTKLLTQKDLEDYAGLLTGKRLESTSEGYKKQKLVAQQLNLIIDYAYKCPVYETESDETESDETYKLDEQGKRIQKKNEKGELVYCDLVSDTINLNKWTFVDNKETKSEDYITCEHFLGYLHDLTSSWSNMTTSRQKLLEYHKYFITYTVRMGSTEDVSKTFKVNVNNHNYALSITMPTAKLTEYLLGGKYLEYLGFETVFVDQNYTGFLGITPDENGVFNRPKCGECNFNSINNFLNSLADITMKSEYLTNLQKITKTNTDNQKIVYYIANGNGNTDDSRAKAILKNIVDNKYLSDAVLKKFLGDNKSNLDKYSFNNIFTYLTGNSKDYSSMTMKQLRLDLMDAIINYQEDPSATTQENKDRYLTLFYMFCSDFVESTTISSGGTTSLASTTTTSTFKLDESTKALILKLAGIENMPDEMLVGLEYEDINSSFNGYDEQNGDVFVICTYDNKKGCYIPFLMSADGTKDGYDVNGANWLEDYGYGIAKTSYYSKNGDGGARVYPVVAKGIITEDGYPTAIRQIDGVTEFYRDNIVIRNASELNLKAYYVTTEQASADYNLFSALTNSIVKVVTGKTLIEHAYDGVPKFEIDTSINFPMGVDEYSIALTSQSVNVDYGMRHLSGLSSQNFYKTTQINFLILFVAILALFPMLIKATYGVFGRVVDITLYYSMSPVMMSTIALGKDTKDGEDSPQFTAWYSKLKEKTISVFGYIVGFQVFFIIVGFFANFEFIDAEAFESLKQLGSMLPFIQDIGTPIINRFVNLVLIICSAYLINEAPKLFAEIMGQSNGFDEGEALKSNIKSTVTEVRDVVNGTHAKNTFNFARETLKDATGINGIMDTVGEVKKKGAKVVSKGAEIYMRANGVPKDVAKQISQQMSNAVSQDVDNKKKLREERRLQAYDAYYQQLGESQSSSNVSKLQQIDDDLYKAGLRKRTNEQHEAIQKGYGKRVDKLKEEEDKKSKK